MLLELGPPRTPLPPPGISENPIFIEAHIETDRTPSAIKSEYLDFSASRGVYDVIIAVFGDFRKADLATY